jgi:hypothetical protein
MAITDVYKVTDFQTLIGVQLINVYWYQATAGSTTGASSLVTAFLADMLPEIINLQTTDTAHLRILAENVADLADFADVALTTDNVGLTAGDVNDTFGAWGFKLIRSTRAVRNGSKRIGGVADSQVDSGLAVSGVIPSLNALAAAMGADIVDGSNVYSPVLRHLTREMIVAGDPPTFSLVSGASYEAYTSQVSRKFGRGS